MHASSLLKMQWFKESYLDELSEEKLHILDVGSYDVCGSYNPLFTGGNWEYRGLDIEKGPNVDIVAEDNYAWPIEDQTFDVVVSGQAFEHVEFVWKTMAEIERVLKPGGMCCIIAPSTGLEHRYPVDCYRFYTDGLVALAKSVNMDVLHASMGCVPGPDSPPEWDSEFNDAILVAMKPGGDRPRKESYPQLTHRRPFRKKVLSLKLFGRKFELFSRRLSSED